MESESPRPFIYDAASAQRHATPQAQPGPQPHVSAQAQLSVVAASHSHVFSQPPSFWLFSFMTLLLVEAGLTRVRAHTQADAPIAPALHRPTGSIGRKSEEILTSRRT
jgi:hypothetical protein